LVQLDGSFHDWLEGRGPGGCLMNMVDDATGTTLCRLGKEETIWAAVGVLRAWMGCYGVPRALYTDGKNVYVREPNAGERMRGEVPVTQFGRRCQELGIEIWAASSPQAKGRVERNHGTHQDRLVKKLRRKKIRTHAHANRYWVKEYCPQHNARYAQPAAAPAKGKVRVCEEEDGSLEIYYRELKLKCQEIAARPVSPQRVKETPAEATPGATTRPQWKPGPEHPWRRGYPERKLGLAPPVPASSWASASAAP
jgi:hypothetical protein